MRLLIDIHTGEIVGVCSGFKYLHYLTDGMAVGAHGRREPDTSRS